MASVTQKDNGNFIIRVFCGRDEGGNKIIKSKIFKPSSPNLSYSKLQKELSNCVRLFEEECATLIENGCVKGGKRPSEMPFPAFCERYLEIHSKNLAPETLHFYKKVINSHLIPKFANMKIGDFRIHHVQSYIVYLSNLKKADGENELSPSTVKRYATVLRSILSLAYKMEYLDTDISASRRLIFPKITSSDIEVFTRDEIEEIFNCLKKEPLNIRVLIELALMTGCRRGEIVALRWCDIDLEQQILNVHRSAYQVAGDEINIKDPKSHNGIRRLCIPQRLCDTLKEYKIFHDQNKAIYGSLWNPDGYLFTQYDGSIMHPDTPTRQYRKFLKRHNIRYIKFHALRHTAATILLTNGCDIKTVSARLGHGDINTTNIYLHAVQTADRQAADTLDKLFPKS